MATSTLTEQQKTERTLESIIVRFAGDSGDGIQVVGGQFGHTSGIAGNDLSTLPDFPAEIRAPAGSLAGVSAFQIHFGDQNIHTPGDEPDTLVAMNPAALKAHLKDLIDGGLLITNSDAFTEANLRRVGYDVNPLASGSLSKYRWINIPLNSLTVNALKELGIKKAEAERCRNFFALGMCYWLYDRPLEPTLEFIHKKFSKNKQIADANEKALKSGFYYAETTELFSSHFRRIKKAVVEPGTYRNVSGNEATAFGFIAASQLCGVPLVYCSYPITPASDVLHELAKYKNFGVRTFQAEDEIAAVTSAIGASFAGSLGLTGTSGPGVALKSEGINLAVMTELPLVILDVMRGGPSTGLPTKTEQSDLLQAYYGRNGESPVAIVAPATPAECFDMAIEAFRLATVHMTPVFLLTDGYLANGVEPWKLPAMDKLPRWQVNYRTKAEGFAPYARDANLARPWAIPGTPGCEHRIGGLEKSNIKGNISYDPANHNEMVHIRAEKVARIANDLPPLKVEGPERGDLLLLGWGSSYGPIRTAAEQLRADGQKVAHVQLRYLNPIQKELGAILKNYKHVLLPELNLGQLSLLLRAKFLMDIRGFNQVTGTPFKVREIKKAALELIKGGL